MARLTPPAFLLSLLILAAPVAHAQSRAPGEAEAALRTAFAELEGMRWGKVAALMHPRALARFRTMHLSSARQREESWKQDTAGPADSTMPPAVAAWFAEQRRMHQPDLKEMLTRQFAGVTTLAQLEALSAEEMFARWLEAQDPRATMLRELEGMKRPIPANVRETLLPKTQRIVLGSVLADDSTAFVVYRVESTLDELRGDSDQRAEDARLAQTMMATVVRTPEGWRVWSSGTDFRLTEPFGMFGGVAFVVASETDEEEEKRLAEAAKQVITWPADTSSRKPPAGRLYLTGYQGKDKPPKALVVEVRQPNGKMARVEVPTEAFMRLMELLSNWPLPTERK